MIRGPQRDRGTRRAPTVDMAPLIDMVFILLIFFLVTTTFTKDRGVTVDRPGARAARPLAAESLRALVTAEGRIFVDGKPVALAAFREICARRVARESRASLVVVPDRALPSGRLVEVVDTARAVGFVDVAIATREEGGG